MTFSPRNIVKSSEKTYNYGKELKGIEKVEWTPSGQFLSVIGFNEVVSNEIVFLCIIYYAFSFFHFYN